MKRARLLEKILTYAILIIVSAITLFPVLYALFSSFKSNAEIMSMTPNFLPKKWTLDSYKAIFAMEDFNILLLLKNSVVYTFVCVASSVLISSITGYVFARGDFPGKKIIEAIFLSLMFVSFGSITIYPLFDLLGVFGLATSIHGLMVMKIFGLNVVHMQLVKSFVKTLPKEIDEAGEIDGCGFTGIFFKLVMPLLLPTIATITVLSFQGSWNEYLMPTLFTITKPEQYTLIVAMMAMKNSGQAAQNWNFMFTSAIIAAIPVLILYFSLGRFYVSGLTTGSVKG